MRVKQISIGVNKIDSDTAGSKREKCDEASNEMKSMMITTCRTKDFIEKNTTSRSSRSDEVLAEQRHTSSRGVSILTFQ